MKKSILKVLVFTLFLMGTEKGISQNSAIGLSDLSSTDELFKIKNTITENNSIDFLKQFYVVSLVENISKNKELIFALNDIIKNDNFSCEKLNSKKIQTFLKNCKTKKLLQEIEKNQYDSFSFFDSKIEEGIRDYNISKLTDEVFGVSVRGCGSAGGYCDQFMLVSEFDNESPAFFEGSEFIDGIIFTAKRKLENKLKTTFHRQDAKAMSLGTTKINDEEYITLPFFEGKENPGGFLYNLIIAYNFKQNKYYYLHDSPNLENDNWKHDKNDMDFDSYTWVTEKNPNWRLID